VKQNSDTRARRQHSTVPVLERPGFVRAACHPPPGTSGADCPQLRNPAATEPPCRSLTSTRSTSASRRTRSLENPGSRNPPPASVSKYRLLTSKRTSDADPNPAWRAHAGQRVPPPGLGSLRPELSAQTSPIPNTNQQIKPLQLHQAAKREPSQVPRSIWNAGNGKWIPPDPITD
jgi:hypothetical protein